MDRNDVPAPYSAPPAPVATPAARSPLPLIIAVVLLGVAGSGLYLQHARYQELQQTQTAQQQALSDLQRGWEARQARDEDAQRALQNRLDNLQTAHDNLRAQFAGGAERFADAQRLHAAQYLLLQANQRLALTQDVAAALQLLESADLELAGGRDSSFAQLRRDLARERGRLNALQLADVRALAEQLAGIQQQVSQLQPLAPVLLAEADGAAPAASRSDTSWLGSFAATWKRYSGDWFLVRRHAEPVTAPPDEANFRQFTLAIGVALSEAQLAALRHDQGWYQSALARAQHLLHAGLNGGPAVDALQTRLRDMATQNVAVPADIKLDSALLRVAAPLPVMPATPVKNAGEAGRESGK